MLAVLVIFIELGFLSGINASNISEISDVLVFVLIIIFSVAYIIMLDKSKRLQNIKMPLFFGYVFRLALLLFDLYGRNIFVLPNCKKDASVYYANSIRYATGVLAEAGEAFSGVMGTLFSWTGISRMLGQFIVMLFSLVSLHAAGRILDEIDISSKSKRKSMYILCLLPNFAILSIAFTRESIITMFMAISLCCFTLWFYRRNEVYFLAAFVFVFLGARFHAGVVGLAVGYIVVRVLYDNRKKAMKLSAKGMIFAVIFLFAFVFLFNNYSDTLFGKMSGVEDVSDIANTGTLGGSSYAAYVGNSNNPINMVIYTPLRIIYFLFSPFPWQWRGLEDIIAFCFSSMFYMWAIISAIRFLKNRNTENRQFVIVLLVLVICTVFVFAWGVSNTGTAARHRDKMVVLYLMLYAATAGKKLKAQRNR